MGFFDPIIICNLGLGPVPHVLLVTYTARFFIVTSEFDAGGNPRMDYHPILLGGEGVEEIPHPA